jgi:LPS export ABC transporter protein LptC
MIRQSDFLVFLFILILVSSCENDIDVVKSISNPKILPDVTASKVETFYSDSAKLKVRILSPEFSDYETVANPYTEFPKGIHAYIYGDSANVIGEIISNYAIYYKSTDMWEARDNVIAYNPKGERLNTEQLFWDIRKKIFYSKKYSKITSPDGSQHIGEKGFEAQEDFNSYKLFGSSGQFMFKDEDQ